MKRTIACLLSAMLLLVFAAAPAEEPAAPAAADELNVAVTTPLTGSFFTAQWGNATSDTDVRAMIHGYNLIEWDASQGMFVPDQAAVSGLVVTQDTQGNRTYTIALCGDLVYSDGMPITARDYAFSLLLTLSPEMAQLGGSPRRMPWLMGADDYAAGRSAAITGLRVLADDQLSLTVSGEYLPFFYELGLLDCLPYPAAVIAPGVRVADDGQGAYLTNADPDAAEPVFTAELLQTTILDPETGYRTHPSVTSGPYTLVSYDDGVAAFALNPLFKGDASGRKPSVTRVTLQAMAQEELIPALSEGRIGLVNKASSAKVIEDGLALTESSELYTCTDYARSGLAFIAFSGDRTAVCDAAVRQAVALAMDRDALVEKTVGTYGKRVDGYYGLSQWMYRLLNGDIDYPVAEGEDDALAAWQSLSLNSIGLCARDPERAAALLDEAGWNLNGEGSPFDPAVDSLRWRQTESGLEPLELRLAYALGSAAGEALESALVDDLRAVGIGLTVEAIPMAELLPQYYRTRESDYDMFFLATNFDLVYDPSANFSLSENGEHVWMTGGIADEALWEAAVAMRRTEPGDLLNYAARWLTFQQRFAQVLPAIPVYSNSYYDFYPAALQGYEPAAAISWPQAMIPATFGDPQPTDGEGN